MIGHTPGPWAYQENSDACTHIVRHGKNKSFILCQLRQSTGGEAEADARLIAAAPEMFDVIQWFLNHGENASPTDFAKQLQKMDDIIKKVNP